MGEANSRDDQQDDQRTANEVHENEPGQNEERNHFMSVYTTIVPCIINSISCLYVAYHVVRRPYRK